MLQYSNVDAGLLCYPASHTLKNESIVIVLENVEETEGAVSTQAAGRPKTKFGGVTWTFRIPPLARF